jgi:transposase-like protein
MYSLKENREVWRVSQKDAPYSDTAIIDGAPSTFTVAELGEMLPNEVVYLFRFRWKSRRRSPSKAAILRRHLLENEPISKLCDELGLQPTVFYRWQTEFFENGAAAFEQKARPNHSAGQERIPYLEKKIQTKDEVPAELMAEHVALRKEIGEL